ncbi:MAG: hypothetical protein HKO65_10850 [Gemmatimonadetes bacterium]|nr:hypothetical protein [Gemmatimonadota bacterium]NNM05574.1 hypothetical protein [Gemmatimonadota bacterium]
MADEARPGNSDPILEEQHAADPSPPHGTGPPPEPSLVGAEPTGSAGPGVLGDTPGNQSKKKGKKKEKAGSARGVETMFRTSYRTHLDLSALADNKANIMISINGIIISILMASVAQNIGFNRNLIFPSAVLAGFCLLSLVYAVLAARPRVTRRETTLEEVRSGRANILFFGNFTSLPEEDFVEGMEELVKDPQRTYTNMTRDIYGLGSVLETKYRLLRVSYTLFMIGLILGVVLFLWALIWPAGAPPLV